MKSVVCQSFGLMVYEDVALKIANIEHELKLRKKLHLNYANYANYGNYAKLRRKYAQTTQLTHKLQPAAKID